jgi:hypothetical protein
VNRVRKVMLERKVILEFRALKGQLDPLEKEGLLAQLDLRVRRELTVLPVPWVVQALTAQRVLMVLEGILVPRGIQVK